MYYIFLAYKMRCTDLGLLINRKSNATRVLSVFFAISFHVLSFYQKKVVLLH